MNQNQHRLIRTLQFLKYLPLLTGGRLGNSTTSFKSPPIAAIYFCKVEIIKSVRCSKREIFPWSVGLTAQVKTPIQYQAA